MCLHNKHTPLLWGPGEWPLSIWKYVLDKMTIFRNVPSVYPKTDHWVIGVFIMQDTVTDCYQTANVNRSYFHDPSMDPYKQITYTINPWLSRPQLSGFGIRKGLKLLRDLKVMISKGDKWPLEIQGGVQNNVSPDNQGLTLLVLLHLCTPHCRSAAWIKIQFQDTSWFRQIIWILHVLCHKTKFNCEIIN